jgi:hypothetical protein
MANNNFLPFAGQSGANVVSQALYAASSYRASGFTSGISSSAAFNKAFRQGTIIAAAVAQTISDVVGVDVIDDGTTATIEGNFLQLLRQPGSFVVDSGTANTLVANLAPAPSSLAAMLGILLVIKIHTTNTGATTLNLNNFGSVNVISDAGASLTSGQLTAGGIAIVVYDGTNFQKVSV